MTQLHLMVVLKISYLLSHQLLNSVNTSQFPSHSDPFTLPPKTGRSKQESFFPTIILNAVGILLPCLQFMFLIFS